jgi:hypothetical protein
MRNERDKLDRVERLLRAQAPAPLSADFKRNIMGSIARLPDPELVAPPQGLAGLTRGLRLLSAGELIAIGMVVLGLVIMLLPGTGGVIESWRWELASLDLSLSIGGIALSCSLLSIIAVGLCAVFMFGVGAYASRNHLIGA